MKRAYRIIHGRQLSIRADIIGTLKQNREEDLTMVGLGSSYLCVVLL